MAHIIIYLILATIIYGVGRTHGRRAMMGQARDAMQSFRSFFK